MFQEVEASRFQDNRHMKAVRLSATRTGHIYPLGNIPGTHFCYRLSRFKGHNVAGKITYTGARMNIYDLMVKTRWVFGSHRF